MGSVYNRGTKAKPNWYVKYKRQDGQWEARPTGLGHAESRRVLQKIEQEIALERFGLARRSTPTLEEVTARWLESRRHLRDNPNDRLRLGKHILPKFGHRALSEITTRDVEEFLAARRDELAASTVVKLRSLLDRIFKSAIAWDLTDRNPITKTSRIRVTRDSDQFGFLSAEQVRRLITHPEIELSERTLYATACLAGLRLGELCCLRWADVDLTQGMLTVARSFNGPTKSGRPRHVPVQHELRKMLATWRHSCPASRECLVFPTDAGQPRSRFYNRRRFQSHLAVAGCPRVRFHDLRHTCAALYVMNNTSLRVIQCLLGHASVTTTERYAHLSPAYLSSEVHRLDLAEPRGVIGANKISN